MKSLLLALPLLLGAAPQEETKTPPPPAENEWAVRPLLVGSPVPEVTLTTFDGIEIDLAREAKAAPTLVVFYRGGW